MADPITKSDVVRVLDDIGLLLELKGESPFKSRAYYNAARQIDTLEEDIRQLVAEGRLSGIKGIGDALNRKITELVETGTLQYYEELKASIPPGHVEMLRIQGLGPKKIRALHDALKIETLGELEYACHENRLVDLPGFGARTQEKILSGIEHFKRYKERHLYAEVVGTAKALLASLLECKAVGSASLGGSIRRCCEVVKDIDLLAASKDPADVAEYFSSLPGVASVIAGGETKVSVELTSGINADLRIVTEEEFPYALHHFTGSKEHNVAMRGRAKQRGIKMNEYGLFAEKGNIACRSEADIFEALGLSFIPPELREDMGEIEAAELGDLPPLVTLGDIRGTFHVHTSASDGASSLEAIVAAAKKLGLQYVGITDHSQSARYAGGLTPDEVRKQHEAIDRINAKEKKFRLFKGIESDILPDGRLDYGDDILESFDFVIVAVHSHFGMSEGEMTARIVRAMKNPRTTILAHPTGRLLLAREPYRVNMEEVIEAAAGAGTIIELNANPHRLDLDWRLCKHARKLGVRIAVNPDAHHAEGLADLEYGVNIARKGWLAKEDVVNCMSLAEMAKFLQKRKAS